MTEQSNESVRAAVRGVYGDIARGARTGCCAPGSCGIDMTVEMVAKARTNAQKLDAKNVEFRLGEIEHLPVADSTVDAILSNCVINLCPDKAPVLS